MELHADIRTLADEARNGQILFVTGAGVSADSGIPTFRGEEGYWTVGSREYRPEDLATHEAFSVMPRDVWHWYIYRRSVCRGAAPNPSHSSLAQLERDLGPRFCLITQNVDGLHLRAGNSLERTHQIHGNIDYMRCLDHDCAGIIQEIPDAMPLIEKSQPLSEEEWALLVCRTCGGPTRPHVLWFDEYYNEEWYRMRTCLREAISADLVITVGTSGATNLPHQVVHAALESGAALIDINPGANPFSEMAERAGRGAWAAQSGVDVIPALSALLSS